MLNIVKRNKKKYLKIKQRKRKPSNLIAYFILFYFAETAHSLTIIETGPFILKNIFLAIRGAGF